MRQERTVQASIFDLVAGHEIGRELRAMSAWLDDHPDQVVLLYVEDHLAEPAAFDATAAATERALGDRIHRPAGSCQSFDAAPSRDDVRAAGAQVILISSCSAGTAWGGLVWSSM